MPTEVIATPRAGQQIARLDRSHAKAFGEFLDDLAARGCNALGYRLSGPAPVDHMCVKHLRDSLRVVVAFEEPDRAWILLVGRHDDQDPVLSVYAELYRLLGVEPPDSAGRDKPPCCDDTTDLPPVLGAAVAEFAERAAKIRRTRRRPASLRICDAAVEQGYGQELALFTTRRWLAPQGREVVSHTSTAVSRSVTDLCEVDANIPADMHGSWGMTDAVCRSRGRSRLMRVSPGCSAWCTPRAGTTHPCCSALATCGVSWKRTAGRPFWNHRSGYHRGSRPSRSCCLAASWPGAGPCVRSRDGRRGATAPAPARDSRG